MEVNFISLRTFLIIFAQMMLCYQLTGGMGFCKFQRLFPTNLNNEIHHRKDNTANVTSQMTTSKVVTKISAAMEETPTHTLNPTTKQQRNTQLNTDQVTTLITTTKQPTTIPSTQNEPTTEQMTTGHPTTNQLTTMPPANNEITTEKMTTTDPTTINITTMSTSTQYIDCHDVYTNGNTADGTYQIRPFNWIGSPFDVFCNMSDGQGWTVFQRRMDGSVDFYLDWMSYKQGFGDLNGEFWLGNEKLFFLTNQKNYELHIDFLDKSRKFYKLTYDSFSIGDEHDKYRLKTLGSYVGYPGGVYDYMLEHKDKLFTTKDQDNDSHGSKNCAVDKTGAWWYTTCGTANLNGDYDGTFTDSIYVRNKDTEEHLYNLPYTEMKVRPVT